tara:strand:- start:205 stop:1125 length:921 start_codon:yes stop_codon:yes gene_type:complete
MIKFKPIDCDIIYLSYDEPNAEQNYNDLCKKVPWAKRVHGVEGSDAAHKACAELSETDRFITVDGDNIIKESFLNQEIDLAMHVDLSTSVISWAGKNVINGLVYGNGGLKCWPKDYVLKMRTHENADPGNIHAQVDFCWDTKYIQMEGTYCDVHNNHTPQQAWRAGFREGVKMALDRGMRVTKEDFLQLHWKNLHRLYIWLMVGEDAKNGSWAIYGARQGLYMTMCTDWDFVNVRDFAYLNKLYKQIPQPVTDEDLLDRIQILGDKLIQQLDIPIASTPLDAQQSKFFKTIYQNPMRMSNKFMEKE